jgi:hypothetical protein
MVTILPDKIPSSSRTRGMRRAHTRARAGIIHSELLFALGLCRSEIYLNAIPLVDREEKCGCILDREI